ncbi:GNAT family N-acetyltransferase [Streptomyces roseicoloratus]|uniref:GNAT family N-acetyltransferase n=1 Tax=Streptomyces roseicoloratus TaxID=2508722 RepID=A0ABY9RY16_9ACTN|nr:GNAT family N-acetyltransferase [Streptomyces roseicoloratus]WMX47082.1 GNAT family N-acetyltransferase [Streptomyces roseicoloratus]
MTTELRVLDPAEWDDWYAVLELAFGGVPEADEERALWRELTEPERSLGAWDGDRCVGTAGAFTFRLSVPGGNVVPAAGVTMVSVAGTHRRRGILTSMMRRQLEDVRRLGEPLAVLTASEPEIYGRFGYGVATHTVRAVIDTTRVRLTVPEGTDGISLRVTTPADALADAEAVYARLVTARPGMVERRPGWERVALLDPPADRDGASPRQCVLAERDGEVVGYAHYAIRPKWSWPGPDGAVVVHQLAGLDPLAEAALWRYLCSVDLTARVEIHSRPVDDGWQHLVTDLRRCEPTLRPVLFVRLVDVGAALAARTYQAPVDVVFEVEDAFCPWNEGRWRLTGDAKGAECVRTEDAADLALSVRELGAAYLGGVSLVSLAAAGLVRELREGALTEASVGFGSPVAPWLPHGF